MRRLLLLSLVSSGIAFSQTSRVPVVFVRGYDFGVILGGSCTPSTAADTFGGLPAQLQQDGATIYFFDQCAAGGGQVASIEALGKLFTQFLATIKDPQVDVIAHSMGGLIVRAHLSGFQSPGSYAPPSDPKIRKAVLIAVPNFGLEIPIPASDAQLTEMKLGSAFLYALGRWNQETDDLRGLDALSILGDAGTTGADDGVVPLNSASLSSFGRGSERTRVLSYCHTDGLSFLGLCNGTSIASAPETATIVRSFLAGTNDWASVGRTLPTTGSATGGVLVTARDANDTPLNITAITYNASANTLTQGPAAFYSPGLPPATYTFTALMGATAAVSAPIQIRAAQFTPVLLKSQPQIAAVIPAAGLIDARVVAPGSLVSLYGSGLAASTLQASGFPFPAALNGTAITSGNTPIPVYFVSDAQVNAYIPPALSGFVNVTLKNAKGQHSTTLYVSPTSPALFFGATGASATHADGSLITSASPAAVGETIVLYATGLGATTTKGGIDYANVVPTVTVGGVSATVLFAGRTPGYVGLDQINVTIPAGIKGNVQAVASSGGRTSNSVTLAIQ
jgi:uncharacterized protein (TIGR03437 family)